MDVDWDGQNEIIIGTYGKQILIYKKGLCPQILVWLQFELISKAWLQLLQIRTLFFGKDSFHTRSIVWSI